MNKKNIVIIGVVVVVLAIIIGVLCFKGSKETDEKLSVAMEKLGRSFFEDYYYPSQQQSQTDVKEYMEKLSVNGIKINLTNLSKISSLDSELINEVKELAENLECDFDKTKVNILPKDPFAAKDYEISLNLECGKIKKSK